MNRGTARSSSRKSCINKKLSLLTLWFLGAPSPSLSLLLKNGRRHRDHRRAESCASRSYYSRLAGAFESELGAQPPVGFYDPLGLLENADRERFERLRYVELKHGRISMLAVLGHMFTAAGLRLPGTIDHHGTSFESIPSGIAALSRIPGAGLAQIFAFVGLLELAVMKDVTGNAEFPGDFRNGFLDYGWDVFTPEEQRRKRAIELNNGRAAMMGILALMVHEMLDNDPYVINSLAGAPVDFNAGLQ